MNKFMEILKPIAWGILLFTAGMTTKVYVTVHEKEKKVMCQPIVSRREVPEKNILFFNRGIITNIVHTYGIPVLQSDPPTLIYPEAHWVTNYVLSKVCKNCGGHSDWMPGDEFSTNKKMPTCQCLAVYPPRQCEYDVIATNIDQYVKWVEVPDIIEGE